MLKVRKTKPSLWERKQALAAPARFYGDGDGSTVNIGGTIDIRIRNGLVTEVWFRCQQLPFRVSYDNNLPAYRSTDYLLPRITGIEVRDVYT